MRVEEIISEIYDVHFNKCRDLAETFLRFQEYYENPHFRGKFFSMDEFKEWYIANSPHCEKTGRFTYYEDWDGFNVPSTILRPFYHGEFDPLTVPEKRLLDKFEAKIGDRFYLIGTHGKACAVAQKHEISHGLFFNNPNYRRQVLRVVRGLNTGDRKKINDFLREYGGCHPDFFDDETAAYLTDRRCLGANGVSSEGLAEAGMKIKRIFREFYNPTSKNYK